MLNYRWLTGHFIITIMCSKLFRIHNVSAHANQPVIATAEWGKKTFKKEKKKGKERKTQDPAHLLNLLPEELPSPACALSGPSIFVPFSALILRRLREVGRYFWGSYVTFLLLREPSSMQEA